METSNSLNLIRFWAIAVLAAMPTALAERLDFAQNQLETIRSAAFMMYVLVPDYAAPARSSIRILADVVATVQHHVRSQSYQVELIRNRMPESRYVGRYPSPCMRSLIIHTGFRKVFREIRNGVWELTDRGKILEQPAIDGCMHVLRDFMSLAEDILYICQSLRLQPHRPHANGTPDALD